MTKNEFNLFLEKSLSELGIEICAEKMTKFEIYRDLLISWNEKMNLTAITDDKDVIIKHFADSLTIVGILSKNAKLIDVGSGAGFPGLPLKIMRGDIDVTLMDSLNKRISFLEAVAEAAGVSVTALHMRAEDAGRASDLREAFDCAVSRAVAPLNLLAEYCLPLVKVGGVFLAMKGANNIDCELDEALFAIETLGGAVKGVHSFRLPDGASRVVIEIAKVCETPPKYPRKAGKPAKYPLSNYDNKKR